VLGYALYSTNPTTQKLRLLQALELKKPYGKSKKEVDG
jgi:hypothetical protein